MLYLPMLCLLGKFVLAADGNADETSDAVELVIDEQFSQEKQEWRKQQLK